MTRSTLHWWLAGACVVLVGGCKPHGPDACPQLDAGACQTGTCPVGTAVTGCEGSTVCAPCGDDGGGQLKDGGGHIDDGGQMVPCAVVDLLSDGNHCGACGHSCLGGSCVGGTCQPVVVASNELNPRALQVADEGVYWLADGVRFWSKRDHVSSTVWAPPSTLRAFAAGPSRIVAATETGEVWSIDRADGGAVKVADGQDRVVGVRAVGDGFFWANFGNSRLMSLDATGAAIEIRADLCFPNGLVAVGARLYVTSPACRGIAEVSTVASEPLQWLYQDLSGGSPQRPSGAGNGIVWFDDSYSGSLRLTPFDGGGTTSSLYTFGPNPVVPSAGPVECVALASDPDHAYFATANESGAGDGHVYALSYDGGTPLAVSDREVSLLSVGADTQLIAWSADEFGMGRVVVQAK